MRLQQTEPPRTRFSTAAPRDPSLGVWLLAAISLILPWVGLPVALWGGLAVANGWPGGWWAVGLGIGLVVLDILIDFVWAAQLAGRTDEPALNRGGEALLGRIARVVAPIENGRGRVRVGDSEWIGEGPDTAVGEGVVIVGVNGTVLKVGTSASAAAKLPPKTSTSP